MFVGSASIGAIMRQWHMDVARALHHQDGSFAGVISADYRIARVHHTTPDKCVEDAKSAVRWLRAKAGEFGVDPDRIAAGGGSAGGHLAAATALVPGFDADDKAGVSCKPNALLLFNPALNLTRASIHDADGKDVGAAISPTRFLAKDAPPAVIFFGTADRLAPQGHEYRDRGKELGCRVELFTAAGQPHGFFNRSPYCELANKRSTTFS